MLKGFRDFIMRGNVIDLAVGVVIGAAFSTLVTSITNAFLTPLIRVFGGGEGIKGATFIIRGQEFDWGLALNALITFVITAAVLYFLVVLPMNKLAERRKRGEVPPPAAPSEEVKLLSEIRDALVAQGKVPHPRTDESEPAQPPTT
ncbi:large conductance mechanosensitive channel protein MscL [Luedemannella flava]|uniref:Large-conductance mechanosensitive channel n=1 Tax=Luedemannella flava TaxID=349316 RepID=A0ABP4YKD9_9ACTN